MTSHVFRPALAAAAILGLCAPAWAGGAEKLNLVERATSDAVLDTGAQGDSAGDILTFANEVFDEANKTKLLDTTLGVLGSLSLAEMEDAGAKNKIRASLVQAYQTVLRARVVDEVYFSEFVIQ